MLKLTIDAIKPEGLFVADVSKNGGSITFKWTESLKSVVKNIFNDRKNSNVLDFFPMEKATPHNAESFKSAWRRAMNKAMAKGLEKRFCERFIRNKSVTDSSSLQQASHTVGHTSFKTTEQYYNMLGRTVIPFDKLA